MSATLHGDQSGTISVSKLVKWLNEFMVYGSDMKLFRCGKDSLFALTQLGQSQQAGFRLKQGAEQPGINHNFQTPFGYAELKADETVQPGEIIAEDLATMPEHVKEKSGGHATNILNVAL